MFDPLVDDEPAIPLDDEPAISLTPEPSEVETPNPEPRTLSLEPAPLMQVLPADFELPKLIRFVPDVRLKEAADAATRYALAVEVSGPEGVARADVALTALRTSLNAISENFVDAAKLANDLHKQITGKRAEWLEPGTNAVRVVGNRIATEQLRLKRIADEERRRLQEEEDRKARELARKRAEEAAKANAPKPVVDEMRKKAETVTAPPVATTAAEPPKLSGQTVVKTWMSRVVGTPADAEPNPTIAEMSPALLAEVMVLLKAITEGRAPITAIEINWSVCNQRAKSDKSTMNIPGLEAFESVGVRAKGRR